MKSARRSPWLRYGLSLTLGAAVGGVLGLLLRSGAGGTGETSSSPPPPRSTDADPLRFLPQAIGAPVDEFGRPFVTHVTIADLDQDRRPDVLYCESSTNTVRWLRQTETGGFFEEIIGEISGPAHVAVADVQGTGRLDVLVASMGQVLPTNDRIGAVFVLENLDNRRFQPRLLLENVARVTDVRAANLAGHRDGRLDLVVGQFGYDQGETQWLENDGNWRFTPHRVNAQSGCVHTPVADFDGDGRADFAALITQEWEEVHLFLNQGGGRFDETILWGSTNEDFGGSGMRVHDLNRDGRPDLLFSNGDGFDYAVRGPRPWHGLQWLRNDGGGAFTYSRIGYMGGAYAPSPADLDGDGDTDLVAVSGFGDWSNPETPSLMAFLNDGAETFTPVVLARTPIQLITVDTGDLDGDGVPEIVTGGFHAFPPYENMSNITLWRRQQ